MDDILLFDLVWKCLVELGIARRGTATGGSTTTVVDTNGLAKIDNRYYDEGTAFILKSTDREAPEKSFSVVSRFDSASKILTLQDTITAVESGDIYGVGSRRYPLYLLTQKINSAIYLDGYIAVDDTTLATIASQTEYTLPVGASRDLKQVLVATNKDSDDNRYVDVVNWGIRYSATGTQDTLVLSYQLAPGYTILLRYATPHGELNDADDVLNEAIHPDRIVYQACADSLRWFKDKTRMRGLEDTLGQLEGKAELARQRHPLPPLPLRQAKVTRISRTLGID